MWLLSNPLFEIGAGLVLIAATLWMLLNARPARRASAAGPPPPSPPTTAVRPLGPAPGRAPRGMRFAEELEAESPPEPPLRFAPPAPAGLELSPAPEPTIEIAPQGESSPGENPFPMVAAAETPTVEPEAVAPAPSPGGRDPEPGLPMETADHDLSEAAPHPPPWPVTPHPSALVPTAAAAAATSPEPAPVAASEPAFEARLLAWLEQALRVVPEAPSVAVVVSGARRIKRGLDPAWSTPAGDLRAAVEALGKLAPAAFAAPGVRDALETLAASASPPLTLIWPDIGSSFEPGRHQALSGEGDVVARVVRPGLAFGVGASPWAALVIKGRSSANSASA